ncbi:hypothetical protein DSECCO2_219390 [anaerobic digester metagenome]
MAIDWPPPFFQILYPGKTLSSAAESYKNITVRPDVVKACAILSIRKHRVNAGANEVSDDEANKNFVRPVEENPGRNDLPRTD